MPSHAKRRSAPPSPTRLRFDGPTPIAPEGLGGLVRDHFANGRIYATVGWHGGLTNLSYWGKQHLGAPHFFNGGLESGWNKLFRACLGLGAKRYYMPLRDTKLYPFGYASSGEVAGVDVDQQLLLLPDALVQRFTVTRNPKKQPVMIEMFHQEGVCAVNREHRTWNQFTLDESANALIATCTDENPVVYKGDDSLSQMGLGLEVRDAPRATTWIGIGCDAPLRVRRSHGNFKLYIGCEPIRGKSVAFSIIFADSESALRARLKHLAKNVHTECDALVAGYEERIAKQPRIDVGDAVLNSAFAQYPEVIRGTKIHDRPGAMRGSYSGYFVWGWDGMTPMVPCVWANDAATSADILRFFHETCDPTVGIPLQLTTAFTARLKEPFPAQAQYIASLYHYVAATGDLKLAREVMPTCLFILDRCRQRLVKDTGLVAANALWPDFPEAMEETGDDISAINNSLLYQGVRAVEYLAQALGDDALAADCRAWATKMRASFVKHLFDQEHGTFISSCSSIDLSPRKHYCAQAIFWITPFARELVAHAPGRIAAFMNDHLRSAKCLLTLPQWDTAWMADGNQLGSSYPTADYAYVNVHKLVGDDTGLRTWLGDVEWFWRYHTAPEAFTPEAENEDLAGPDNHGGKQLQAVTAWYACAYHGIAGLDLDHEGLTLTPWGSMPVRIDGLRLRGTTIDLRIRGTGNHVGSLTLNGKKLPAGTRKIPWSLLSGKKSRIELVRSKRAPAHPVIVRADGLRVIETKASRGKLTARIAGDMSGDVAIQVDAKATVRVDGKPVECVREASTGTVSVAYAPGRELVVEVTQRG